LTILGGIVALDAVMVAGFAALKSLRRHRSARDIRDLEALWALDASPQVSSLRGRHAFDKGRASAGLPVGEHERGAATDLGSPSTSRATVRPESRRRRVVGLVLLAAMVCAGTAFAHPGAREAIETAFGRVTQGLAPESGSHEQAPAIVGQGSEPIAPSVSAPRREPHHSHASPPDGRNSAQATSPVRGAPTRNAPPVVSPATDPSTVVDPASPTAVTAVAVSSTQIDLTWIDVTSESGYRVEGSPDGADGWVTIVTLGQDVLDYSVTELMPGTTYYYRVFAMNAAGESAPSDVVSATIVDAAGPTSVAAVAISSTQIDLTWNDVTTETGYRVEGSPDGSSGWVTLATTGQDVTTHSDGGLLPGTTYYYRVIATNAGSDSGPSDVASATTKPDPASPAVMKTVHGATQIDLTWTDVADETGYRIERSADGAGGWITLATTGQDVVRYRDAELVPGTTYYYRVFATNADGDSAPSDVVSVTTRELIAR
jgi:fibronectin type 3 domain-containing protein